MARGLALKGGILGFGVQSYVRMGNSLWGFWILCGFLQRHGWSCLSTWWRGGGGGGRFLGFGEREI